ncbi:PAS domain-containing sensor histidine kinase [Urbifossiella limnaea]|uniref:histidine kinase n=1 Tax=Urbifossiella limnaea TaxID=2528023 RepID=A0A517XTK4_9BACT|nr:PAS domain-containing sensor histidine kinase [Urbifossiella limnaea]QDU20827.1 Sensor protein ZraS [Urbifossiella limnaea]
MKSFPAAESAAILDSLPVVVFRIGPDLRLTYANRPTCELLGLTPTQVVGRSCLEVGMEPATYGRWVEHLRTAFRTGQPGRFQYLRPPPPAEMLFEYRFVPERGADGAVASVLVAAFTVDEVKELRAELRAEEERFRAFMDRLPANAWMRNEAGVYVFVNSTYLAHYGFRPQDVIGRTVDEVWPADVAARFRSTDERVYAVWRAEQFLEVAPEPDGTPRSWLNVKFPFTGPDGVRYVGGVGIDVTDREREAAARRELDARLVSAEKIQALALLAAGSAHDFKNVLSVILGNADLAAGAVPAESPAREYLRQLSLAGDRAAELCSQMFAFAGGAQPRPGPTDLGAVARDTLRMSQPPRTSGVRVVVAAESNLPPVWADPSQLSQVVLNLVTNAVQAIGRNPGTVRVGVSAADDCVIMEVSDDGCGIPAAHLGRVFDPFFTTKPDGSGLGLAAVAGIVRDLGGTIAAESAAGAGTTFRVSLPAYHA